MAVQGVKSGARTWANLRLAIHEARSPLTVIAYASELLLEDGPDADPRVRRRHLDAIHRAAHEAAGCLTLLSRCVEVEEAAAASWLPRVIVLGPGNAIASRRGI